MKQKRNFQTRQQPEPALKFVPVNKAEEHSNTNPQKGQWTAVPLEKDYSFRYDTLQLQAPFMIPYQEITVHLS
jgi:hypothetical protein